MEEPGLQALHRRVAGIDVHRILHVVTVLIEQDDASIQRQALVGVNYLGRPACPHRPQPMRQGSGQGLRLQTLEQDCRTALLRLGVAVKHMVGNEQTAGVQVGEAPQIG